MNKEKGSPSISAPAKVIISLFDLIIGDNKCWDFYLTISNLLINFHSGISNSISFAIFNITVSQKALIYKEASESSGVFYKLIITNFFFLVLFYFLFNKYLSPTTCGI